jgi:23S rRNA (cytidine2498-2'-O)-methyltransferase
MATVTPLGGAVYVAAEEYEEELMEELGTEAERLTPRAPLFIVPGAPRRVAWASNVWLDPVRVHFSSAADAVAALARIGPSFASLDGPPALVGAIPSPANRMLSFPERLPSSPIGAWAPLDANTLVAATRTSRPFPSGVPRFVGDKTGPPSRAYLKLWEALTLARRWPRAGDWCVDLGSSPGGWTWALERLGAHVVSVDKAPLDPRIAELRRVEFRRMSAFALDPPSVSRVDWVVSDVICYPARTVDLVQRWMAAHPSARFVVTVKFQGETEMEPLRPLRDIAGSELLHLHHNKHELTWMKT